MLPQKQKIYKKVYDEARERLLGADIERQLNNAALQYEIGTGTFTISLPFFDETVSLTVPQFAFRSAKGSNVTLVTKIVILHYINTADGSPPGSSIVAYEDIPGCRHYQPVFEKRVAKPLQSAFGRDRYAFLDAGAAIGGKKEEYGDASITLFALPRIPITFILWEGDEEFRPLVRVLFDPSITGYLPLEDIVVISKLAASRILKAARKQHMEEEDYGLSIIFPFGSDKNLPITR
ncbi:MAG TPA: DUF3786 domain-containing protein [Syntrophorhabdaceae bacterium]|nr:DUF3786 domain-containing protein [Syntrophorhabdaceae bacterium]HQM81501.1 DUF3786 domain-containing protein [Syntrophorhabdaceae bacterium]